MHGRISIIAFIQLCPNLHRVCPVKFGLISVHPKTSDKAVTMQSDALERRGNALNISLPADAERRTSTNRR